MDPKIVKITTTKFGIIGVFKLSDLKSNELRKLSQKHLDQRVWLSVGNFPALLMPIVSPLSNGELVVGFPLSESDNVRLLNDALIKK